MLVLQVIICPHLSKFDNKQAGCDQILQIQDIDRESEGKEVWEWDPTEPEETFRTLKLLDVMFIKTN